MLPARETPQGAADRFGSEPGQEPGQDHRNSADARVARQRTTLSCSGHRARLRLDATQSNAFGSLGGAAIQPTTTPTVFAATSAKDMKR